MSSQHGRWAAFTLVVAAACAGTADQLDRCTAVDVVPVSLPLAVGDSTELTSAYDAGCSAPVPLAELRWSSSNATIARVDSLSGVVHGIRAGSVDIVIGVSGTTTPLGSARVVVFAPLYDRIIAVRSKIRCNNASCSDWSGNGPIGLWTFATDGSDPRILRDSMRYPDHPRVSPDGRWVVYDEWGSLYIMDGAGLAAREIARPHGNNWGPAWSPDGRWIVFVAYDSVQSKSQIYLIRPDGTGFRPLTADPFGASDPAWSPNGTDIVFVRDSMANGRQAGAAMLVDSAGTNLRVVSGGIGPFYGRAPEWSPDGASLVFLSRPFLTRLDLASGQYDTVSVYDTNRPSAWSADGSRILVGGGAIGFFDPTGRYPNNGFHTLRPFSPDSTMSLPVFYTPHAP